MEANPYFTEIKLWVKISNKNIQLLRDTRDCRPVILSKKSGAGVQVLFNSTDITPIAAVKNHRVTWDTFEENTFPL